MNFHSMIIPKIKMSSYFDLLPEEIIQYIYKFVFNNTIDSIIKKKDYNDKCCIMITRQLKKRKGFWLDKLKEDYNVVLFKKKRWGIPWNTHLGSYEDYINLKRNKIFTSVYGYNSKPEDYQKMFLNRLRNSQDYTKDYLKEELRLNGYRFCPTTLEEKRHYNILFNNQVKWIYKSWTRDRMITELLSL